VVGFFGKAHWHFKAYGHFAEKHVFSSKKPVFLKGVVFFGKIH
jgi:hypothetical protein